MAIVLIDSYSESNYSNTTNIHIGSYTNFGQSFLNSSSVILDSAKFYLRKIGSPPGDIVALLYDGESGTPTGSVLATSDAVSASTLSTGIGLINFNFSGANRIVLNASTHYFIICCYNNGDASNRIAIGYDNTSSTHAGSRTRSVDGTTWSTSSTGDCCFYVYGDDSGGAPVEYTTTVETATLSLTAYDVGSYTGRRTVVDTATLTLIAYEIASRSAFKTAVETATLTIITFDIASMCGYFTHIDTAILTLSTWDISSTHRTFRNHPRRGVLQTHHDGRRKKFF